MITEMSLMVVALGLLVAANLGYGTWWVMLIAALLCVAIALILQTIRHARERGRFTR